MVRSLPCFSMPNPTVLRLPLALLALAATASAQEELWKAITEGEANLSLRWRYELADDDGRPDPGHASTLRTTLGWRTAPFRGFQGYLEFEDITVVGNELFDSTINGMTNRGLVADPESTEVNQLLVSYDGFEDVDLTVGRQVIKFGNQRFVGDVLWRQNQQTFDAVRADWRPTEEVAVTAAWVENVNRIFGENSPVGDTRMKSVLFEGSYKGVSDTVVSVFGLLLDADEDLPAQSTNTVGLRAVGFTDVGELELLYDGSLATQSDQGDNPNDVDQEYVAAELGVRWPGSRTTAKVGYEKLGGSGATGDAFQTPLATAHKFNGWADRFLVTPDAGLEDLYFHVGGKAGRASWALRYHVFESDSGGMDYGTEWDAVYQRPLDEYWSLGLKAAYYDADDFSADILRAWFWLELGL